MLVCFGGGNAERFSCILRDRWKNLRNRFGPSKRLKTLIRYTVFRKYEKLGPKQQLVDIMGTYLFYQKCIGLSFYQEGRRTTHRSNTETVINASRSINKFDLYNI